MVNSKEKSEPPWVRPLSLKHRRSLAAPNAQEDMRVVGRQIASRNTDRHFITRQTAIDVAVVDLHRTDCVVAQVAAGQLSFPIALLVAQDIARHQHDTGADRNATHWSKNVRYLANGHETRHDTHIPELQGCLLPGPKAVSRTNHMTKLT